MKEKLKEIPYGQILDRLFNTNDKLFLVATSDKRKLFGKPIGADLISVGNLKKEIQSRLEQPLERISEETRPTREEEYDKFVSFVHSRSAIALNDSFSENGKVLISIKTLIDYLSLIREEGRKKEQVEPLQNGEREEELLELLDELKDNIRSQPEVIKFKASYQPIIDYMNRLLSQSKKEGIEEGWEKGLEQGELGQNIETHEEDLRWRQLWKEHNTILSEKQDREVKKLESLTNQSKLTTK